MQAGFTYTPDHGRSPTIRNSINKDRSSKRLEMPISFDNLDLRYRRKDADDTEGNPEEFNLAELAFELRTS